MADPRNYLGRYQQGDYLFLLVVIEDGSAEPHLPDACPRVDIYGPAGAVLVSGLYLSQTEKNYATYLFGVTIFLGTGYTAGHYTAVVRWAVSGTALEKVITWDIAAGGDATGRVTSLAWYPRPQADYVIQGRVASQPDTPGRAYRSKNPRR